MSTSPVSGQDAPLLHFKLLTSNQFDQEPLLKTDPKPICAICLDEFLENPDPDVGMPVAYHGNETVIHPYHFDCIAKWFLVPNEDDELQNNCPVCKQIVDTDHFFQKLKVRDPSSIDVVAPQPTRAIQARLLPASDQALVGLAEITQFAKELLSHLGHFALIVMGGVCVSGLLGPIVGLGFLIVTAKSFAEELRQKYQS